jgi:hypothetical protein
MPRAADVFGLTRLERYGKFWDWRKQVMLITPHTKIEDLPQFLTVEEWRTFMRIGRSSAYDLIRQGLVPVIRWGRTVRLSREVVLRCVDRDGQPRNGTAPDGQAGGGNTQRVTKD